LRKIHVIKVKTQVKIETLVLFGVSSCAEKKNRDLASAED